LDEVVEEDAFLDFLALGAREDLSARPCVEGYLGDTFLFATDFLGGVLKEDKVGQKWVLLERYPCSLLGSKESPVQECSRVSDRRASW